MAKAAVVSSFLLSFVTLLLFFLTSGLAEASSDGQLSGSKAADQRKTWCIPKPSADQATLLVNINYACSQPQVDCKILQKGYPCNGPDNLVNHASIAMNMYYQSKGRNPWNCDFRGSGLIVVTDPSYGNCIYP